LPSGVYAIAAIMPLWTAIVLCAPPVAASQSRIEPSPHPVAIVLPSGDQASATLGFMGVPASNDIRERGAPAVVVRTISRSPER
jgi:hypothetical protein